MPRQPPRLVVLRVHDLDVCLGHSDISRKDAHALHQALPLRVPQSASRSPEGSGDVLRRGPEQPAAEPDALRIGRSRPPSASLASARRLRSESTPRWAHAFRLESWRRAWTADRRNQACKQSARLGATRLMHWTTSGSAAAPASDACSSMPKEEPSRLGSSDLVVVRSERALGADPDASNRRVADAWRALSRRRESPRTSYCVNAGRHLAPPLG